MKSATASNQKISWFAREDDSGALDLSPDFQRRPVWSVEQSSYLIDTILNALPFPEIYIRAYTSSSGVTSYEVVDGQQRIRSILEFARNDLTLIGDEISPRLLGKSIDDLSDEEKREFWNYDVVTRELYEATDGDIRDLFRRLNINAVNLNDQELRHAHYTGEFIDTMEDLADDSWWLEHRIVNLQQVRRMLDVEYISELFIVLMAGPQDKKKTIDSYYADFDGEFPDRDDWVKNFRSTRALLEKILPQGELIRWSGKSDFYSLFHIASTYVERQSRWTKQQLTQTTRKLKSFRNNVNQAKRRENTKTFAKYVHSYADAVTRAATDVARRKLRSDVLMNLFKSARR